MKKIPVIIDCDPGADDSLGILLALRSEKLCILGITTVCGNAPAYQTALNATKVLKLAEAKEIQVYQGEEQPLERNLEFHTKYSGADGLCETGLIEDKTRISTESAVTYLIRVLKETEEPITVITMAGFTNLAKALQKDPEIKHNMKEIVAASGYFGLNQKEHRAEWNILVDPEAAELVFKAGIPVRAIGLDVTCMLENDYIDEVLSGTQGYVSDFLKACDRYNRKVGLSPYSLLVDAMAVAATEEPEIASYTTGSVTIHPEKTDASLMEFTVGEGVVHAADTFKMERYLEKIKGMIIK